MKKNRVYSIITILMSLLIIINVVNPIECSAATTYSWSFVDGNGSNGLNGDVTQNATKPSLATFNNELYAAWSEVTGKSTSVIRVKKYDGSTWSFVDGGTISINTNNKSDTPKLIEYKGNLYVIWQESSPYFKIRAKKYDGKSWTPVDGGDGISTNTSVNAINPYAIVYKDELYVIWNESDGKIKIRKYNDNDSSWKDVIGIDASKGLNYDSSKGAQYPTAAICNNKLYVAWQENNESSTYLIRVKSFDGNAWNSEDGNNGINKDSTKSAGVPQLINYNNELYAVWSEADASYQQHIRVKKYDGATWTLKDGDDTNGLGFGCVPRAVVYNNQLYVIYYGNNGSFFNKLNMNVKTYDGTTWSLATAGGTTGINKDTNQDAYYGTLAELNGKLYAAWNENDSSSKSQIRVATMMVTKSTVATVTSTKYTVSEAGLTNESITNVPDGTTKADFLAALTKEEAHESFDDANLHDPVVSGDKLVVTAEDGTTKVTYTITVNQSPATAPTSIVLEKGSTNSVGQVVNVVIPAAGETDSTGEITGWASGTQDKIKFAVTDGAAAHSTIKINGADYTSGDDYTIASGVSSLAIVVTTTEAGKLAQTRNFIVSVAEATKVNVDSGSVLGVVAGDRSITGLTPAKTYNVEILNGSNSGKYVDKSGYVYSSPVSITGVSSITRLVNGTTYRVIEVTPVPASGMTVNAAAKSTPESGKIMLTVTPAASDANHKVYYRITDSDPTAPNVGDFIILEGWKAVTDTNAHELSVPNGSYIEAIEVTTDKIVTKWGKSAATNDEYVASVTTPITGSVVDDGSGSEVSQISATVTTYDNGNETVSMNAAQAVTMKQPDGKGSTIADISKITVVAADGSSISVSEDGQIQVKGLAKGTDNKYKIMYDLGNGIKLAIGTIEIKVASDGSVSLVSSLIDPYGIITDAASGEAMQGVNVTLYYADTQRNRANGKTPNTVVSLPGIDGFKPNNNKNPQISDANGAYGFMVFPNADYYIVAVKDGYDKYVSETISVNEEIVRYDFKMNKAKAVNQATSQNTSSSTDKKLVQTGSILNDNVLVAIGLVFMVLGTIIVFKRD